MSNLFDLLAKSAIYRKYFKGPEVGNNVGKLTDEEMNYILGLSEVIYYSSSDQEAEKLNKAVRKWASNRTEKDGYLDAYREGVAALKNITKNEGYNALFYNLTVTERENILDTIDYTQVKVYHKPSVKRPVKVIKFLYSSILNHKEKRHIFFLSLLRKELTKGIFLSSLGWQKVGPNSYPGVAGTLEEYTRPPEIKTSDLHEV